MEKKQAEISSILERPNWNECGGYGWNNQWIIIIKILKLVENCESDKYLRHVSSLALGKTIKFDEISQREWEIKIEKLAFFLVNQTYGCTQILFLAMDSEITPGGGWMMLNTILAIQVSCLQSKCLTLYCLLSF